MALMVGWKGTRGSSVYGSRGKSEYDAFKELRGIHCNSSIELK